jgi:hypothetical protein
MVKYLLLLQICCLICSCSLPEEEATDIWSSLFDSALGISIAASPPTIAPNGTNSVQVTIRPRYAGKGFVYVLAQEASEPIGHILEPSESEFGSILFPLTFVPGEVVESVFVVQFYPGRSSVGLSAQATYDSLTIDGLTHAIDSPESVAQIGPFAISTITAYAVLRTEEKQ